MCYALYLQHTAAAVEAAVAKVGHIAFHGPLVVHFSFTSAALEAVVAKVGHIAFHGPWVVHVSFTYATFEALWLQLQATLCSMGLVRM